jgi:hypothetical protein
MAALLVVLGGNSTPHITFPRITLTFICNLIKSSVRTRILSKLMDSAIVHHGMVWWHLNIVAVDHLCPWLLSILERQLFLLDVLVPKRF